MKINKLRIEGYKCFLDSKVIPFHNLTVFIGENDAGKTSIINAMEILLTNKQVTDEDYHYSQNNDSSSANITIQAEFITSPHEDNPFYINNLFNLKKVIDKVNGVSFFVLKQAYLDERLNRIDTLLVEPLKEIAREFNIPENQRREDLRNAILSFLDTNTQKTELKYVEVQWKEISNLLPFFQRFNSSDYGNPNNLISKVLQGVYRSHFYEQDENGKEKEKGTYATLRDTIESDLDAKIEASLKEKVQKYNSNVISVKGRYNIDFAKGLDFFQLEIDTGNGLKPLSARGEGAKKRLFLSILEWDKQLERELKNQRGVIKTYDEPDANLHFDAQRKLFYEISKENADDSNIQSIICTHSLTMIDRASAHSINRLVLNDYEQSEIEYLMTDDDDEIRDFLFQISEIGGIKNSSIFYERCFVLVEGPTEENALPILYKKFTGRNLSEDGVVLINLQSNGAWKNFLKLLNKNKKNCILIFLDADTQYATSSAQVTVERLREIGFDDIFLTDKVIFAGNKEFEETFPDDILVGMLNHNFPKQTQILWNIEEISELKSTSEKYSEDILRVISRENRMQVGKPEVALKFANFIENDRIVELHEVKTLFDKIAEIIK